MKYLLIVFGIALIGNVSAQKQETLIVKTKVYCSHCKVCETCGQKFETDLYYVKGIKEVEYNENDTTITIVYKPKKTNPDKIRKEIAKLGFDADNIPADPAGVAQLDACCRKKED